MKKLKYKLLLLMMMLFIMALPNISNAAKVSVGTVNKLWVKYTTSSKIKIKWKEVKKATGYRVYIYNSSKDKYIYYAKTSDTSIKIKNLKSAKKYRIKVKAYKKKNGKKYYGSFSPKIITSTKPKQVKNFKVTGQTDTTISLKWSEVTRATAYKVYVYNSSSNKFEYKQSTYTNSIKLTGMNPDKNYKIRVRAYKKLDGVKYYGEYSKVKEGKTNPLSLNKVTGFKINKTTKNSIEVKWDRVKGATGYAVYVFRDSSQSFKLYNTTSNTSLNITGLAAAKFYKMYVKSYANINGKTYYSSASTTISGKTNSTNTEIAGIDVSAHNQTIDWEKVKKSGVEFAILRCGFGQDYKSQDDKYFARNVSECERLKIPYGVYLYSYALNTKTASSEADHALRLLKGHTPKYGVWFDMEDADKYKQRNGMPSDETLVNICVEFCDKMIKNGYKTGIYASLSWFKNQLNDSKLDKYDKWVAQWNDKCSYTKDYVMWQYTSSGLVDGINGRTDMNIMYLKLTEEPTTPTPVVPE